MQAIAGALMWKPVAKTCQLKSALAKSPSVKSLVRIIIYLLNLSISLSIPLAISGTTTEEPSVSTTGEPAATTAVQPTGEFTKCQQQASEAEAARAEVS